MMSSGCTNFQESKQILGEHLYSRVEERYPQDASRITGILLEAGNQDVIRMLQDDTLLQQRVEGAQRVLQHFESDSRPHQDELGEKLFYRVYELDSQHCAKVTGMLLELDSDTIHHLLSSPQDLLRAVQKAQMSLILEQDQDQCCQDELEEDKQEIGEKLYSVIEETHPELASKLTGMILEMDISRLRELMDRPSELKDKIQLACDALNSASTPPKS